MTNRSIRTLSWLFVGFFAVLALRQAYVQIVAAPSIAARPNNPRHVLLDDFRGRILASDGTVLAHT
ncbi:MAG: penicillin-binding protein 2, partial [Candidatus Eremiobacteraeota bacterium]|nr:penicillin-binding protein 2 [Candidatus Eremiobacteraeota bacterium]